MATIFVHNLILTGTHGAHLPTAKPKEFRVDMDIEVTDIADAMATDDIHHVYDYRHAVTIARHVIEGPSVHLIETLASRIVEEIKKHPKVQNIKLTLAKREPWDQFDSGITLSL
jgi:dihydroneopterin aldolase